jgi:hypothetical protein
VPNEPSLNELDLGLWPTEVDVAIDLAHAEQCTFTLQNDAPAMGNKTMAFEGHLLR